MASDAFRDEILKELAKSLRKRDELDRKTLEALHDLNATNSRLADELSELRKDRRKNGR